MIPIASAPGPAGGSTRADGWDRIRAIEIHPGSGPRTHDPNRPTGAMTGSGGNLADRSGTSVGPYRLDALLGRGGMGAVYAARDARLGRRVAVKHVPADADAARRQRFRREAAALARLSHPAIVRIFDLVEAADGDWIVMELVEGPTLAQLVAGGPLPVTRAVAIGRQVAEGLAEAHAQGILHRDLKTENVMLDLRGPSTAHGGGAADRAMILDFGLAKSLGGEEWETPLSVSGQILGTYRAMSPEQVRGLPLDPRSDLFSLGVLLYEITTGERPFRGDTPLETLNQVTRHPHLAARSPSSSIACSKSRRRCGRRAPARWRTLWPSWRPRSALPKSTPSPARRSRRSRRSPRRPPACSSPPPAPAATGRPSAAAAACWRSPPALSPPPSWSPCSPATPGRAGFRRRLGSPSTPPARPTPRPSCAWA
jgi:serine/threonine protein kinase